MQRGLKFIGVFALGCVATFFVVSLRTKISQTPAPQSFPSASSASHSLTKTKSRTAEPLPLISSEDSDEQLLAIARDLVSRSPQSAIDFAQSQTDPELRERMLLAAFQAWDEADPRAALNWLLVQDRTATQLEAALKGAAKQSEISVQFVRELIAKDPETGDTCATMLVGALSASGQYQTALKLAASMAVESQNNSLDAVFRRWGRDRPEDAITNLNSMTDPKLRGAAFRSVMDGWSENNFSSLAAYARSLPAGEERQYALDKALDTWALQDPVNLAGWLNQSDSSPELDSAIAALITRTDSVERTPETALGWAESIHDPQLRFTVITHALKEWSATDRPAAQSYIARAKWLLPEQREQLLGVLTVAVSRPPPPD
jgi:hypothetical protein